MTGRGVRSRRLFQLVCLAGLFAAPHASATTVKSPTQGKDTPRRRAEVPPRQRGDVNASHSKAKEPGRAASDAFPRHRVKRGETLESIALRYDTNATLLASANGLKDSDKIRSGQLLVVVQESQALPERTERTERAELPVRAESVSVAMPLRPAPPNASWLRYVRAPKAKGHLDLATTTMRFAGRAVDRRGRLEPDAVRALNNLLNAGGTHPRVPERLLHLLVRVSDTFGGRPIRIVSGYRTSSYYEDSRHKHSAAVDFSIAGVPNEIVRDFLREFDDVGVGYYPNSSFVHLDVRPQAAYWVDYAGPGEPPRSSPNAPAKLPRGTERKLLAELDGLLQHATKAIERLRAKPSRESARAMPRANGGDEERRSADTTSL